MDSSYMQYKADTDFWYQMNRAMTDSPAELFFAIGVLVVLLFLYFFLKREYD